MPLTYTAVCPAGHPGATWHTEMDTITSCGGIVAVECAVCDPAVTVEPEPVLPPLSAVVTAPGVVTALRCIARKILYGGPA